VHHKRNRRSRKATSHQRTILYFTIFFGGLAVLVTVGVIWFLSRPHVPGSPAN
jgi:putative flippase GtrA